MLFQFIWAHPSAPQKEIAKALKMSLANVKVGLWELRKRDLPKFCPECFTPSLVGGVCHSCGFEPFEPALPLDVLRDSQSPTNALHPGNMLGSDTDYGAIGFVNSGEILKRKIDRAIERPLIDAIRSDVANSLDCTARPDIADQAGRLVLKEVREFRARYPMMGRSKLVRRQLAENVLKRLILLHPHLARVTRLSR
jgi:hypothetical protein